MDKLILVGGGGHCKSCIDVIEYQKKYSIAGIIDKQDKIGQSVLGYKIIADDNEFANIIKDGYYFLITVGQLKTPDVRISIYNKLKSLNAKFASVVSPLAYVSKFAKISEGSIIMHDAVINADVSVGNNCIINTKALIEHDCKIGSHCHISTCSVLNGGVCVGDMSFIGSNSTVIQGIKIPSGTFIKAGSLVK